MKKKRLFRVIAIIFALIGVACIIYSILHENSTHNYPLVAGLLSITAGNICNMRSRKTEE